ncbi:molybdenum cofactor guanylyltransferase MobA [Zavarzinia compransoris]|uniref:Molybdenum cofactor guanylyltransferase n=1 Tax=Zavarzinia compransoris TaxID=1264899 RepID=A0A317EAE0_9PROT|nr:molybdenum cofactor guanylyltransferase MobA [Zavarzinia compransoris]PWR23196.1 molybdenum cofactor guanylyltransferase MobA [Zavarzinia compransoris]TDP46245.1 molybdenum cofactor guanylyltransferase [Zavarzinia compransoris]
MRPAGLILAGGLSRRFGGGHKGLAPLDGRPLAAHVIERVAPQCAALALNVNGPAGAFAAFGLPLVADGIAGHPGPLAGVLAGLRWLAAAGAGDLLLTVTVDEPFVPLDLAARLAAVRSAPGMIAHAAAGGRSHYLAALWPLAVADDLERALTIDGLARIRDFIARHPVATADFGPGPPDPFFNVNTPDDLAAAAVALPAAPQHPAATVPTDAE